VVVEDVTVAQNGAPQGAGVFNDGVILQLSSTTIVHNWVDGVFTRRGGSTHLRSSVLQNPTNCGVDAATIIDDLANFATDLTCWLGPGSTQGVAADPRLGSPAQDPHGLTVYYPPLLFSPLVDRGFQCPPLDQIGNARSGPCDIGAIEGSDTIIIFK
jgi:hypothetical protein